MGLFAFRRLREQEAAAAALAAVAPPAAPPLAEQEPTPARRSRARKPRTTAPAPASD